MEKFAKIIVKHKKTVIVLFIIGIILSMAFSRLVTVNYDMIEYLPNTMPSINAIDKLDEEFKFNGTTEVMLENVSVKEAEKIVTQIEGVEGIRNILWLGSTVDLNQPIEYADKNTVNNFYKNNNALLQIMFEKGNFDTVTLSAMDDIYSIIGEKGYVTGQAQSAKHTIESIGSNIQMAMVILIPIICLVLILTMNSFFEVVLLLSTIGISILLNSGTNIILGEISFASTSAASILQLAIAMDYTIFLIHRFTEENKKFDNPNDAMISAIKHSASSILASGTTTVAGFLALIFMTFRIGYDMGIVLAKGIVLSLICVFTILPVLVLYTYKLIEKTKHKSIFPSLKKFGAGIVKIRWGILATVILIALPVYLAQNSNKFIYASQDGSDVTVAQSKIEESFGAQNKTILLVPKGEKLTEKQMVDEIKTLPHVTSVLGLYTSIDPELPESMLPKNISKQFLSDNYSMYAIIINATTESKEAFATFNAIDDLAKNCYKEYYLTGATPSSWDLKVVGEQDYLVVMLISILAVGLVLIIMFKSATLPVILLLVIEIAIWLNMSVAYFGNVSMQFIAYLIVSSLQLGATIDYAILYTNRYRQARGEMLPKEAAAHAMDTAGPSILTSSITLGITGIALYISFDDLMLKSMGLLVGRGAFISGFMVILALPAFLVILDKVIEKTTYKWNAQTVHIPQKSQKREKRK